MCRNIRTLFNFDPPVHRRGNSRRRVAVRAQSQRLHQTVEGQRGGVSVLGRRNCAHLDATCCNRSKPTRRRRIAPKRSPGRGRARQSASRRSRRHRLPRVDAPARCSHAARILSREAEICRPSRSASMPNPAHPRTLQRSVRTRRACRRSQSLRRQSGLRPGVPVQRVRNRHVVDAQQREELSLFGRLKAWAHDGKAGVHRQSARLSRVPAVRRRVPRTRAAPRADRRTAEGRGERSSPRADRDFAGTRRRAARGQKSCSKDRVSRFRSSTSSACRSNKASRTCPRTGAKRFFRSVTRRSNGPPTSRCGASIRRARGPQTSCCTNSR